MNPTKIHKVFLLCLGGNFTTIGFSVRARLQFFFESTPQLQLDFNFTLANIDPRHDRWFNEGSMRFNEGSTKVQGQINITPRRDQQML